MKNDAGLLPLEPGAETVAVIGEFARAPRFQGAGSGHVNPVRVDVPLDELRALAGDGRVTFAAGFSTDGTGDAAALRAEACTVAAAAGTAVVFLGLAATQESEGFDRATIDLPADQVELLAAVAAVQPRTVVVLAHGGLVSLAPVAALVPAVVDAAMVGQAMGGAVADVLFGRVNPSGRLAETVPLRLQDVPAFLNFPGANGEVLYGERLYVGYRWYDARALDVAFPFGHGLSYTTFDYRDLVVEVGEAGITVRVTVTNTGGRAGHEVVQVYVGLPGSAVERVPRELKAFATVALAPGESRTVEMLVRREDLAYWDVRVDRWVVEGGTYEVAVGASSRDLRSVAAATVDGDEVRVSLSLESTLAEFLAHPTAGPRLAGALAAMFGGAGADGAGSDEAGSGGSGFGAAAGEGGLGVDLMRFLAEVPVGRLTGLAGGDVGDGELAAVVRQAIDAS